MAVQSHWFSVGPLCAWARAGIGAVATQSVVEPAYGPNALDRLAEDVNAQQALGELLAADPLARVRQVAVIDIRGVRRRPTRARTASSHAGHVTGEHHSCQANMMARDTVPPAMSDAFVAATGALAERLLAALDAAEAEGGDIRGRQSAAMVVVPPEGEPWRRTVDLRVEDHGAPLDELRRLLTLQRAYDLAGAGDELLAAGRTEEAGALYQRAAEIAPSSDELLFWSGLALAQAGDLEGGVAAVRRAAEENPNWLVLLERLSPEFAPAAVRGAYVSRSPEGGTSPAAAPVSTLTALRARRRGDARGLGGGGADRRRRERALADVLAEVDGVDVAGAAVCWRSRRRPDGWSLTVAVGGRPAANRSEPASAVTSDAAAKSAASLPSTRSALRPVATPVALVVNGAPVVAPVSMRPPSGPTVVNSKARPPLRLVARTQGSLPGLERQP